MTIHLTPPLQEEYGRKQLFVEATYLGLMNDEEVEAEKDSGNLKEISNMIQLSEHHIVFYAGERWVNDLLGVNEEVEFNPIV
jgi:hypothetical protein